MPRSVGDCCALALMVLCTLWPLLQPASCMPTNLAAPALSHRGAHKGALLSGKDFLSVLVASRPRLVAPEAVATPSEPPTRVPSGLLERWGRLQTGATPPAGTSLLEALADTPPTPPTPEGIQVTEEGYTEAATGTWEMAEEPAAEAIPPTPDRIDLLNTPPEPTEAPEEPPTEPPPVEERLPVPDSLEQESPLRPAFALPEGNPEVPDVSPAVMPEEEERVGLLPPPPETASLEAAEPPPRRRDQKSLRRRYLLRHPPHDNAVLVHGGEPAEANYEVPEEVSVASRGRVHGPQGDPRQKFGYVVEGRNFRKYRVEERTADGFIVGEYGVLSHEGVLRGVRYTADGTISPRLIHEALVKFLSL